MDIYVFITVKTLLIQVTKHASDQFLVCIVVKVVPATNLITIIMKYREIYMTKPK